MSIIQANAVGQMNLECQNAILLKLTLSWQIVVYMCGPDTAAVTKMDVCDQVTTL